ncbi:MAG: CHAT domain-containing protein, partial [Bacteroidetes bacterium]|nr:CHAT domain-containing protein [Bacteroidota bacterium]
MRIFLSFIITLIIFSSGLLSQNADTAEARIYLDKAKQFMSENKADRAFFSLNQAEEIYQSVRYFPGMIKVYNTTAELFTDLGDLDRADSTLSLAKTVCQDQNLTETEDYANTLHGMGVVSWKRRKFSQAESLANQSLELKRKLFGENHLSVAAAYDILGLIAQQKGEYAFSIRLFKKALKIRETKKESLSSDYNHLGLAYFHSGNYYQAETYYLKAIEALNQQSIPPLNQSRGRNYMNLGNVYLNLGDFDQAESYYREAIYIFQQLYGPNHDGVAIGYFNLSHILAENSEIEKALGQCEKALEIFQEMYGAKHERIALVKQNLGHLYGRLGNEKLAENYHFQALKIIEDLYGKNHYLYGALLQEISSFYLSANQLKKALEFNQQAQRVLIAANPRHPDHATLLSEQGKIYHKMGNSDASMIAFQKSADIWENTIGEKYYVLAAVYTQLSEVAMEAGKYESALNYAKKGMYANTRDWDQTQAFPQPEDFISLTQAIYNYQTQAKILDKTGKPDQALQYILSADKLLTSIKLSINSEKGQLSWAEETFPMYDTGVKLAINQYHQSGDVSYLNQAFQLVERSKSSLLLESLQDTKAKQFAQIPAEVLREEKEIQSLFSYYRDQLFAEQRNGALADSVRISRFRKNIFALEQQYDSLVTRMETKYPRYYDLKYEVKTLNIEQVQRMLTNNQIMLSYFWGQDSLYIFSISHNHQTISAVSHQKIDVVKLDAFLNSCTQMNSHFKENLPLAQTYYQFLVEEPLSHHGEKQHLVIIPDGKLGYLPFEILQTDLAESETPDFRELPYLMKKYRTSYAYSATLFEQNLLNNPVNQEPFLGYAPTYASNVNPGYSSRGQNAMPLLSNLNGTVLEIQQAQKIWGGKIILGEEATEMNFKSQSSHPAIIHLAMHALVNDQEPLQSRLLFYQPQHDSLSGEYRSASLENLNSSFEDSYLNVHEIYNLELNSQLAVLSACNTGVGVMHRGEGIFSLARAFMYAGVPSIITSLWKARDLPTQQIMAIFYKNLKAGMSKDEALRQAKLSYL